MTSSAPSSASASEQSKSLNSRRKSCELRNRDTSAKSQNGRPELENLLDFIRDGDILVVTRLDRLARSVFDLQDIANKLKDKGAGLKVLEQPVDTTTSAGRMFYTILGAFAEFELDIRRERQMEGISKAKAEGKYKGRAPTAQAKLDEIKKLAAQGMQKTEIARQLSVSRASVYRVRLEMN